MQLEEVIIPAYVVLRKKISFNIGPLQIKVRNFYFEQINCTTA